MNEAEAPRIFRDAVLAPFSRDHYTALVQARKLREAPDSDMASCGRIAVNFLTAWEHEIKDHFDDEERLLLDLMNPEDKARTLSEHKQVRDLVHQISLVRAGHKAAPATMHELGQLLDRHVRWEERELFNRLQESLDRRQREELKRQTAKIDPARGRKPRLQ